MDIKFKRLKLIKMQQFQIKHLVRVQKLTQSPITSMSIIQMFITFVVIVVCDHFIRLTFETHTLITSAASDSKAPICSFYWHFTAFKGTDSHSILQHVLFKERITTNFGFFTCYTLMPRLFAFTTESCGTNVTLEI